MAFFTGSPQSIQQLQKFSPEQQQSMNQLLQQAMGTLRQPQSFDERAQIARKGFETQGIPGLAERLGELGGESKYSSGFSGGLLGAQGQFEQDLLGQREQFNERQQQNALSMLQAGLQPQFETAIQPQNLGFLGGLAPGIGQGLGKALPDIISGALGGTTGGISTAISLLMKLLSGLGGGENSNSQRTPYQEVHGGQ